MNVKCCCSISFGNWDKIIYLDFLWCFVCCRLRDWITAFSWGWRLWLYSFLLFLVYVVFRFSVCLLFRVHFVFSCNLILLWVCLLNKFLKLSHVMLYPLDIGGTNFWEGCWSTVYGWSKGPTGLLHNFC